MSREADIQAGADWAKRLFPNGRRAQADADPRKPYAQRVKEWGDQCRAEAVAADATKPLGTQARRFPSSHAVGERRTAMDGTLWQRVS